MTKRNEMTKRKFIVAPGTCPLCGSTNVSYEGSDSNENVISYDCGCDDCGAMWCEDYELTFCGVSKVDDAEGNQVGRVINLNGEEVC